MANEITDWHTEYVDWGDSWERLAQQHGLTVDELQAKNGIRHKTEGGKKRNDALYIGQRLLVPGK